MSSNKAPQTILPNRKELDNIARDNKITDILNNYKAIITPTVVSPLELGTNNEFGGTSGLPTKNIDDIPFNKEQMPVRRNKDGTVFEPDKYSKLQRYDYDKSMIVEDELSQLERYNRMINEELMEIKNKNNVYNLSIKQIIINMVFTFIIINSEILYYLKYSKNPSISGIITILSKNDRLFYIGLFFILISIFLMIINLFS